MDPHKAKKKTMYIYLVLSIGLCSAQKTLQARPNNEKNDKRIDANQMCYTCPLAPSTEMMIHTGIMINRCLTPFHSVCFLRFGLSLNGAATNDALRRDYCLANVFSSISLSVFLK